MPKCATLIHVDNEVDQYTRIVAGILTQAKDRSGLSFTKISERTDIARATIVRVLAGERPISAFYLHQLARVFGTTPSAVLAEADALDASVDTAADSGNVIQGRFGVAPPAEDGLDAVARVTDPEPDEEPTS